MSISKKWRKKAEYYRWFARTYPNANFSEDAAEAMYIYESTGKGVVNHYHTVDGMVNGFALGKHLQDIQIAMWAEDLKRPFMLTKFELLTDPQLLEVRPLIVDIFGDLGEDISDTACDNSQLHKYVGKYMY